MSITTQLVAIIAALLSLYLVTRGWSAHAHSKMATVKMGLIWAAIIAGVALLVRILGV